MTSSGRGFSDYVQRRFRPKIRDQNQVHAVRRPVGRALIVHSLVTWTGELPSLDMTKIWRWSPRNLWNAISFPSGDQSAQNAATESDVSCSGSPRPAPSRMR